ncbi:MAG: glycosyltransferase [Lachnospiraceae bacterium]|nr:glycosyltransferase [Lachnospiraceae bacterium]
MKKINVLLSAYNGEKYIKEQIDSILAQTWDNVEIYVRDDGSTDKTADILKEYEKAGKIKLELGKNVGFIKSFFWLVRNSGDADYYAYADQDDSWFPEKLAMAVEKLESEVSEEDLSSLPVLYFSNYDYYDEELNFVSHAFSEDDIKNPTFRNCIVDCMPLGFNSVFNKVAKDMMTKDTPKYSCGHDWWTYMICQGMGKVIYDNRPTVKYRRTGNNVSAGGMSFIKFQIWRIKKFIIGGYFLNVRKMLAEYRYLYNHKLQPEDSKLLSLFTRKNYNLIVALKKTFYPKMFRQKAVDELMLRFFFLIGRL